MSALVSIIMPTYNSASFIGETIRSVLHQTYSHWELLVVDDASSDDTIQVINSYSDERIKVFSLRENGGAAIARNKGITEAAGDYIAFLDADDLWEPHKLTTQLAVMKAKNALVCFSSYELMDENSQPLGKVVKALAVLTYAKLLRSNYVGNLTGMYDTRSLGKVYAPLLRKRQDWGLWLQCVKKAGVAYGIEEPLAKYRVRAGSISSNKIEMLKYNYAVYRKALNFGFLKSQAMLLRFLWEQFFVKSKQIISTKDQ